jgi:CTP:molybdopterin cytidylyltransferase MocA
MSLLVVVLAAGGGTRFHGATHKLLAPLRGRPVVEHAIAAAAGAAIGDVVVITGAAPLDGVALPAGVRLVPNPHWADGQATSLQVAVAEARAGGHDAVVIGLGDQPFVPAEAWRLVAGAPGELAVAVLEGARTPPVKVAASLWDELPTSGDAGARVLLQRLPHLVVPVACPGSPVDIDTAEDLAEWN